MLRLLQLEPWSLPEQTALRFHDVCVGGIRTPAVSQSVESGYHPPHPWRISTRLCQLDVNDGGQRESR